VVAALLISSSACQACHLRQVEPPRLTAATLPGSQLREDNAAIRARLGTEESAVDALEATTDPEQQRAIIHRLIVFFSVYVVERQRWEQDGLFDLVDLYVGGRVRFTQSLREEHQILRGWVAELEQAARTLPPQAAAVARTARAILTLKRVHLEVEDRLLFPILERARAGRTMGRADPGPG
jgi:hemerythrin-like domain-containing protein